MRQALSRGATPDQLFKQASSARSTLDIRSTEIAPSTRVCTCSHLCRIALKPAKPPPICGVCSSFTNDSEFGLVLAALRGLLTRQRACEVVDTDGLPQSQSAHADAEQVPLVVKKLLTMRSKANVIMVTVLCSKACVHVAIIVRWT